MRLNCRRSEIRDYPCLLFPSRGFRVFLSSRLSHAYIRGATKGRSKVTCYTCIECVKCHLNPTFRGPRNPARISMLYAYPLCEYRPPNILVLFIIYRECTSAAVLEQVVKMAINPISIGVAGYPFCLCMWKDRFHFLSFYPSSSFPSHLLPFSPYLSSSPSLSRTSATHLLGTTFELGRIPR